MGLKGMTPADAPTQDTTQDATGAVKRPRAPLPDDLTFVDDETLEAYLSRGGLRKGVKVTPAINNAINAIAYGQNMNFNSFVYSLLYDVALQYYKRTGVSLSALEGGGDA